MSGIGADAGRVDGWLNAKHMLVVFNNCTTERPTKLLAVAATRFKVKCQGAFSMPFRFVSVCSQGFAGKIAAVTTRPSKEAHVVLEEVAPT